MNCKPGILAYIVPPARFNRGRVVKVVEAAEDMDGFPAWVVSVDGAPIIGINRKDRPTQLYFSCPVPR